MADLQVGGIGLGQRPRGGDLPVFALVGSQNRLKVRHELLVTGHNGLHGSFPSARPESAHSPAYSTAEQRAHRLRPSVLCDSRNTWATALVFVDFRAYMALSFNDQHSNDVLPCPGRLRTAKGGDMTDKAIELHPHRGMMAQKARPRRRTRAGRR
jgi:hypothetical protein